MKKTKTACNKHLTLKRNPGLTPVPYWGYNQNGERIPLCRWAHPSEESCEDIEKAPAKQGL